MQDKKYNVIIAAGDGSFNLGDEAVIGSFLNNLKKLDKDIKLKAITIDPNKTFEIHNIEGIRMDMSLSGFLFSIPKIIKEFSRMDLLIWGGGNLITDGPSVLYTPFHLTKVALAKILGKKVVAYAIGVEPVRTGFVRFITRLIANQIDLITVRDEESKEILKDIGVNKPKIYVTADPAFDLEPENINKVRKKLEKDLDFNSNDYKLIIAISPRRVFHRKASSLIPIKYRVKLNLIPKENCERFKRFEKSLAMAADYLIEKYNALVLFIPMQMIREQQQDDDKICKEIISMMRNKENTRLVNSYKYNVNELKAIYGITDLILGVRFHSLVLGTGMLVPVISLPYSEKGERLTKRLGLEDYSIKVDDVNYSKLKNNIDKALREREIITKKIKKRVDELRKLCKKNVKMIIEILR